MAITNFAQEVFRSDADQFLVPRQRFNFTVILDFSNKPSVTFTRVSTVTAPSFTFDVTVLNQYNKKRNIQNRLEYDPITVAFYDTYDSQWHNIMREYMSFYYNGREGIERRTSLEGNSTIDPQFVTDLGFTPNAGRYFFTQIRIIQNGYRNRYRETILKNPVITQIQGDTLDYSDSYPVSYSVTFQPESVQTQDVSTQFDDNI